MRVLSWALATFAAMAVVIGDEAPNADPTAASELLVEGEDSSLWAASARRRSSGGRIGGGFRPTPPAPRPPRPSPQPRPSPTVPSSSRPSPPPPGGGARRRGPPTPRPSPPAPVPNPSSRRRGAVSPPIPSSSLGGSATRRRTGNADRTNPNPNPRRRSSDGWETDYSRRRGYSGSTVLLAGGLGFGGGLVLGSMINSGSGTYYHHSSGWADRNGAYHQAGYYSDDGYHYNNPREFGYCPPFGDPGYEQGCDTSQSGGGGDAGGAIVLICCLCCCCLLCAALMSNRGAGGDSKGGYRKSEDDDDEDDSMEMSARDEEDENIRYALNGETVSYADAVGFLQAVEAEFVDGQEGAVGNLFAERSYSEDAVSALGVDEDKIRDSDDPQEAIRSLARRWRMMNMLSSS